MANNTHLRILTTPKTKITPQEILAGLGVSTVVFDNPDLRGGFAQVPYVVLRDTRLSPTGLKLYMILLMYAWQNGQCFPGQARLSMDMGCTARTVISTIAELKKLKFIRVERRGQGKINIYHIRRLTDRYPKQIIDKSSGG
jgi:hypothetical protein